MKRKVQLLCAAYLAVFTFTTCLAADVRSGLVSYWPLDNFDLAQEITPDVVASNNLSLVDFSDASSLVPGKFGQGLAFDSSSQQYAVFTGDTNVDTGLPITRNQAYSILFWANANATGQSDLRCFSEADVAAANNNPLYAVGTQQFGTNAFPRLFLRNSAGTVLVDATPTNAFFDGTWHHLALVYNGGPFTVYEDGNVIYTNAYPPDTTGVWDTTALGAVVRAAPASFFTGKMDDVAVWARALSQVEVQNVMSNSIQTPVPQFAPGISVAPTAATNLLVGDFWTFGAGVYGSRPLSYQWIKDGTNLTGQTGLALSLTNLALTDSGDYALVVTNAQGSVTSVVARLVVNNFAPNITAGLVAYWPLDTIIGGKTPDLVSGYDMTAMNMTTAGNVVAGKWGSALSFTNATHTLLERVDNPGEDLPIYNKAEFTISLWVNGAGGQTDRRVWSEGSTGNNNPLFNLGTDHNGGTGRGDSFIRNNTGATSGDHHYSVATPFDGTWHNVVYSQRLVGSTTVAAWYFDGVKDSVVPNPIYPLTLNTTSIGGILRSSPSSWFEGLIDEVAVWNRGLSGPEVQVLQVTSITNPPSRLQPLSINSFKADLPAVVKGGSTVLRWDVSKDAGAVSISPSLGDVTSKTIVGVGTNGIVLTNTTTFVLTVQRGTSTLTATTTVAVVSGAAPGWALLDNFETYDAGPLSLTSWWLDLRGNSVQITNFSGNKVMTTLAADSDAILNLQTNTMAELHFGTLFFRMILPSPGTTQPVHVVGLTDKNPRSYSDIANAGVGGIGPVVFPAIVLDPLSGTNAWFLGARNGIGATTDYTTGPLSPGVYQVWIDITNAPMADPAGGFVSDTFSVYLQREGDSSRTNVFDNYASDRDPNFVDVIIGSMQPNLDKLVVAGNSASDSAMFDDFYLSSGAYNPTAPVPFAGNVSSLPPLQIHLSGGSVQIQWSAGTLQQAPSATGPWADVTGNPSSPFSAAISGTQMFFRARQ
jgi:concanavalin A-like lectin/glucanase superfamily protein